MYGKNIRLMSVKPNINFSKEKEKFLSEIVKIFTHKTSIKTILFKINNADDTIVDTSNKVKNVKIKFGIPFFADDNNYTSNFGLQWNKFKKTQLDSNNGSSISEDRFFKATGWSKEELNNKLFLDVGCGTGRFSEIILKYGGKVISLDYSNSVFAAKENLCSFPKCLVIQGDLHNLPFKKETFDYIICLGVLQHTPNVEKAFKSIVPFLKRGGKICVDYYWKRMITLLDAKYLIRIFTKNINENKLWDFINKIHPYLYFISNVLISIPLVGIYLKRLIPVANYKNVYNLSKENLKIWSLLDTYDAISPKHDNPQKSEDVKKWASDSNLININVLHAGHLVVRGKREGRNSN